jgi:cytidylate kinase
MIIAIDGPAGAGKSTVCKMLAKELGYTYLDTGAMYRAIAWALLKNGLNAEESAGLDKTLARLPLSFTVEKGALSIRYEGGQLGEELRPPEITRHASRISRISSVRAFLTEWQRRLAADGKVVAEGRDMTTVVFPDAPVKVFLTADLPTRARRRQAEYLSKGITIDFSALEDQIRSRDAADQARELAPLRAAPDALVLDTSNMDISEVVNSLRELISRKKESPTDSGSVA